MSVAARSSILDRITIDPEVCGGRACIRGTRLRVVDLLEAMAGGDTRLDLLGAYPYLEDADITAALVFAARSADHTTLMAG